MFRKVNGMFKGFRTIVNSLILEPTYVARERIIGWYHTGPKLRRGDENINEVLKRFVPNPVSNLLICLFSRY